MTNRPQAPAIIAHRGASAAAPENTLRAARLAWDMGADAVEIDVRLTRDGHIVALHDGSTGRTADRDLTVAHSTLAGLQGLSFGHEQTERIATLQEFLEHVPPGKQLVIELKAGEELLEPLREAFTFFPSTLTALITFDLLLAAKAKKLFPEIDSLWIVETGRSPATIQAAREAGLQGIDFHATHEAADNAWIQSLHEAGLLAWTWTIDDPLHAAHLLRSGIDALTTNVPDRMLEMKMRRDH